MSDGISKGIGDQLGGIGKQIVQEVTQLPAKLTGFEAPYEKKGGGSGSKGGQKQKSLPTQKTSNRQDFNLIEVLKQQDEIKKQKELAFTRQMIREFSKPQTEGTIAQKQEFEEMEKQKKEIQEERKKAEKVLKQPSTKAKRGNLFGLKAKKFGGEQGKNVKSQ